MTSRRDWQLQQLGITQWALRRPAALKGEIALTLPEHIRLTIVTDTPAALDEPFLQDVLRALRVAEHEVFSLTPDRVAMLPAGSHCNSWYLGVQPGAALSGAQLHSPGLPELLNSAEARSALWRQICEHEQDFFS
ncbi:DNA polymerase III subunit psi [Erwinia sp. HR93]|uniref:DNA polymerase III subunit psi n=1 Tax=Erwinia sp. HR93 TaxID=3094840 RepID=UPI002ADEB951|nr:DNA polymerase III subunit psi [Erwinia sp. HR93]MEA1063500.1 DNA polymerase III subunit psi [Erwinia sp. HR93]